MAGNTLHQLIVVVKFNLIRLHCHSIICCRNADMYCYCTRNGIKYYLHNQNIFLFKDKLTWLPKWLALCYAFFQIHVERSIDNSYTEVGSTFRVYSKGTGSENC